MTHLKMRKWSHNEKIYGKKCNFDRNYNISSGVQTNDSQTASSTTTFSLENLTYFEEVMELEGDSILNERQSIVGEERSFHDDLKSSLNMTVPERIGKFLPAIAVLFFSCLKC